MGEIDIGFPLKDRMNNEDEHFCGQHIAIRKVKMFLIKFPKYVLNFHKKNNFF